MIRSVPLVRVAAGMVDPSGVEPAASLPHSVPLLAAPPTPLLDRQRRIIQIDTLAVAMSCAGMLRAVPHRVHLQYTNALISFATFPDVCPEPVWVKKIVLSIKIASIYPPLRRIK